MDTWRLRLNAMLVIIIAGLSFGTSPAPAMATGGITAGGDCGICWFEGECPNQNQREFHCGVQCGIWEAGSCIAGEIFYTMFNCPSVPDYGWVCAEGEH